MHPFKNLLLSCWLPGALAGYTFVAQAQQQPLPPPPPPATMRSLPLPKPVGATNATAAQSVYLPTNSLVQGAAALRATNSIGGKIQFATTVHDFGKIKAGDAVKVSFTFTNVGLQPLEITAVAPQCGCTVAGEWTRKVEPGKTGEIPLQFNTASYHGQVFKTVTVSTTDSMQPHVLLQLRGNIWKPIDLVPPYTVMNILPDMTNASATVKIVNNMDEPLQLSEPEIGVPGFMAELTTNIPGKEYQIHLTAGTPLNPGTLSGKVTLKTSAASTPTLDVPFWANVQAPVMVMPPQLMLPPGPISANSTPTVTIQNNTTNVLSVSDPVVSLPGVEAQIRELQPGRIFNVQLTFPGGYELKQGEQAALTLKTSHPRYSELRIPIYQVAKPVTPATPQLRSFRPLNSPMRPAGKVAAPTITPAAQ